MQEKEQKISPIKQRILQFVNTLGISKRDFYANTGISRGTLESKTGITEETITKLFATYNNISSDWLLTGTGDMIKQFCNVDENCKVDCKVNCKVDDRKDAESTILPQFINQLLSKIEEKDALITEQAKSIGALQKEVEMLQKGFGGMDTDFTVSDDARVAKRASVRQ